MKTAKKVCCLYRAESIEADQAEINRQRSLCLQYAKVHGWSVLREYWSKKDCPNESQNMDDPLVELCAEAKKRKFDILLVAEFNKMGRVPMECSYAAAFFERHNVEVWETESGHIGAYVRKW